MVHTWGTSKPPHSPPLLLSFSPPLLRYDYFAVGLTAPPRPTDGTWHRGLYGHGDLLIGPAPHLPQRIVELYVLDTSSSSSSSSSSSASQYDSANSTVTCILPAMDGSDWSNMIGATGAAGGAPLNGSLPISVIQGRHVVNVTKPDTEGVREFSSDCIDPNRFV